MDKVKQKSYILNVVKNKDKLSWALYLFGDTGLLVAAGEDKGYSTSDIMKALEDHFTDPVEEKADD